MQFIKYPVILLFFFIACKKEKETSLNYTEVNSQTGYDLRCIYMHNQNEILAGGGDETHGVLLLSIDQGSSFKILNQTFSSRVNAVCFQGPAKVFVACNNFSLMLSDDRGLTWTKIQNTTPVPYQYQTNLFDVKFINDTVGFFCGGEEYAHGIIGRTTNGGQTWTYTYFDHEFRSIAFKDALHGYCGGYGAMLYTDDGGETWQLTESHNEFITSISLTSTNGVACGYQGGIFCNQNTLDWEEKSKSNNSFNSRWHFNSVCTQDNNNYFVFGNNGKCAISSDAGNSWEQATAFDDNTIFDAIALSPTSGIAVGESGKIFRFNK